VNIDEVYCKIVLLIRLTSTNPGASYYTVKQSLSV